MSHGINKDRASGCKCQPTAVKKNNFVEHCINEQG